MANSTPLPPVARTDSEIDYKPISGVAVAAVVVSGFFVLFVLSTSIAAMITKRPALNIPFLFLAGLGLALSIAARAHIRRSEGTRAGLSWASAAWWMSVLGGVGFGAYLGASFLALQKQSNGSAMDWFELLKKNKVDHAFVLTLPPLQRPQDYQKLGDDDLGKVLDGRFGAGPLPGFRNSEIARFFQRNGNEVEVVSLGMSDWQQIENGYRVQCSYQLKSPEGVFDLNLALSGTEGENLVGRVWHVGVEGGLSSKGRTSYGRLVLELQDEARGNAIEWLKSASFHDREAIYLATLPTSERVARENALVIRRMIEKWLEVYVPAYIAPVLADPKVQDVAITDLLARNFFQLEGMPLLTEDKKNSFREIWKACIFLPVGATRLQTPESGPQPLIAIDAKEIAYRFPLEIGLPGTPISYAKARLVLVSNTPDLLKELQELKAKGKANPGELDKSETQLLKSRTARNWRVERIETDLEPLVAPSRPGGPGGPPGGGGGPGH